MGVSDLWNLLRSEGMVREWNCETDGQLVQKAVAAKLEGKVVAVDVSLWTCQALMQGALVEVFPEEEARVVKVAFDRIINYLRFGCTPVGVLDGDAPEQKLETLQARFFSRFNRAGGGGGNSHFVHLCSLTAQLFKAMGLWVVQAPGEAEAVCAALDRAGHVDACVTKDSDALLFGAQTLFQTIKPVTSTPNECKLSSVAMRDVRAYLGINEGGELALTAIALLTGGDYHMGGAEGVGQKQALAVVKHLLKGQKSDVGVLDSLAELLAQPPEEHAEVLRHDKCTGCKRCGHEGGRKSSMKNHSTRNPCECCPPAHDGTCRQHVHGSCACAFHRLESLRVVYKAVQKARESPGFLEKAAAAEDAYREQMEEAAKAVAEFGEEQELEPRQRLTWQHRPNVPQVARLVERCGLPWEEQKTRGKMMALLMEWDASNPSTQGEFVPTELVKPHGGQDWRHLMAWKRTNIGSSKDIEADRERLQEKNKSGDFRCLRISTVRDCWPALLQAYERKRAEAADKAAKKEARKAAKEGRAAPQQATAQSREIARMAASMQAFLQPQRKQHAATKPLDKSAAAHSAGDGGDRGLGVLRPSVSNRGGDACNRGASADEAGESEARGRGDDAAAQALARRLGVHSSSSDESGGNAAVSEGQAWVDVLAEDGASAPRETRRGVNSDAAGVDPPGLHSPGKRGRGPAAADVGRSPESSPAESRPAEAATGRNADIIVLGSPEKRQRVPSAAAAGPSRPPSLGRAGRQGAGVPGGQPAAADFSIRRPPALPVASGRGRGRRGSRSAAAVGTAHIERFLQKQPGTCKAALSAGAPGRAEPAGRAPEGTFCAAASHGTPLRGAVAQAGEHPTLQESPIDLTQSASPQRAPHEGAIHAAQHGGSCKTAATVLRSPGGRCSVERGIEELLQSRGVLPLPAAAEQTPQPRPGRQLSFMTPSTDGDIVVDLVTPPSSQPVGD